MVIPGCGRALITDVRTGAITILPVGGGNETWYNPGDGNFYVTGANFSITPAGPNSLGVIDARSSTIRQYVTALNATNPTAAAENNHIFAVVPANATTATACTQFGAAGGRHVPIGSQQPFTQVIAHAARIPSSPVMSTAIAMSGPPAMSSPGPSSTRAFRS